MIIKICPQSAGVILIRDGFVLNCGLGILSHGRQFINLPPQSVAVLYRIICARGWVSAREVVDWVYRDQRNGGSIQAQKDVNGLVSKIRRQTYQKFRVCIPIRPTRTGYEFLDRNRQMQPIRPRASLEMVAQ